eukprot:Blabericola_migrator_1__2798@NODE_17_length_22983_cov_74_609923_g14_i0_p11_GENE_NODE_17_length_22983_cov_74_609923_g14_i0NODE_17_length_22983_cov_74_609923_g14_i0_p11_ORF_typecomplete_len148_score12_53_NODE_17_length_22983_cov_74_609923_g14_i01729317736
MFRCCQTPRQQHDDYEFTEESVSAIGEGSPKQRRSVEHTPATSIPEEGEDIPLPPDITPPPLDTIQEVKEKRSSSSSSSSSYELAASPRSNTPGHRRYVPPSPAPYRPISDGLLASPDSFVRVSPKKGSKKSRPSVTVEHVETVSSN